MRRRRSPNGPSNGMIRRHPLLLLPRALLGGVLIGALAAAIVLLPPDWRTAPVLTALVACTLAALWRWLGYPALAWRCFALFLLPRRVVVHELVGITQEVRRIPLHGAHVTCRRHPLDYLLNTGALIIHSEGGPIERFSFLTPFDRLKALVEARARLAEPYPLRMLPYQEDWLEESDPVALEEERR